MDKSETSQHSVKDISIIVPVYNEEECIDSFIKTITNEFSKCNNFPNYYILFVNDGSADSTQKKITEICKTNKNYKYVSFSRNFGKESAIFAGIEYSIKYLSTSHYILMDADLQDPPSLIPKMLDQINLDNQCDCVCVYKSSRKGEPRLRSLFSNWFYKALNKVSNIEVKEGTRDFRLMSKQYCQAVLQCGEYNRFFKGIASWVGFNVRWLEYTNANRIQGNSKWSFWNLVRYSLEALTAYTTWPLSIISIIGFLLALISIVLFAVIFVKAIILGDPVAGWPSLACLILLIGSLLLTALGVLGLYFEKMYLELKNRPLYIVRKSNIDISNKTKS